MSHLHHFRCPIPTIGKVFIVEDGDRATRLAKDSRDFIKKSLARIHVLTAVVHRIIAMLADRQHSIDAQFVAAALQGGSDRREDPDAILLRDITSHVASFGKLINIKTDDIHSRFNPFPIEIIGLEKVFEDHMCVTAISEFRDNRGDALARRWISKQILSCTDIHERECSRSCC